MASMLTIRQYPYGTVQMEWPPEDREPFQISGVDDFRKWRNMETLNEVPKKEKYPLGKTATWDIRHKEWVRDYLYKIGHQIYT